MRCFGQNNVCLLVLIVSSCQLNNTARNGGDRFTWGASGGVVGCSRDRTLASIDACEENILCAIAVPGSVVDSCVWACLVSVVVRPSAIAFTNEKMDTSRHQKMCQTGRKHAAYFYRACILRKFVACFQSLVFDLGKTGEIVCH